MTALTLDWDSGKCDSLSDQTERGLLEHRFGGLFLCAIVPFLFAIRPTASTS